MTSEFTVAQVDAPLARTARLCFCDPYYIAPRGPASFIEGLLHASNTCSDDMIAPA